MPAKSVPKHSLGGPRAAPERRRALSRIVVNDRIFGYLFLAPALLLVLTVVYYSLGYTAWLSFLDWDGLSPDPRFIGLDNYRRLIADPTVLATLRHTLIFSFVILIQMALGLFFAVALHSRIRLAGLYKVILFLPVVMSPAVMAPVFRQIFDADGSLNELLRIVGLGMLAHPWLADPKTSLYVLMAVNVWQWTGFSFILYYAGLTQIDQSTIEAARLDGASNRQVLSLVIVPMLSGTHWTLLILGAIGSLKTFDIVFLITGGGPAQASEFLSTYIYKQAIMQFRVGYAGALSILLLVLALIFTLLQGRRGGGAAS